MKLKDEGEAYITAIPRLRKWINECAMCHRKGYRPDLPDRISVVEGSQDVYYIKKYFRPLELNEEGLCEVCAKLKK